MPRPLIRFHKDPHSTIDYGCDWSAWLAPGDSVSSAQWLIPAGLTITDEEMAGAVAKVFLSGGTAGEDYKVTCRVTTAQGRIEDASFLIRCREK